MSSKAKKPLCHKTYAKASQNQQIKSLNLVKMCHNNKKHLGTGMVQIRDSLPLVDGVATMDSATLTANLALNSDFVKQLATQKLHSALDRSENASLTIDVDEWLSLVAQRIGVRDTPLLRQAVQFIKDDTTVAQRSGAYVTGIGMADILSYLFQDETALVAAMLYRHSRLSPDALKEIGHSFGEEVATLVADTLAMGQLSEHIESNKRLDEYFTNNAHEHLSGIYSMLISTTDDVRAVLIKLAERTFAMRELSFASIDRQKRVAREVMTIYAPLAHRLGIAQLKWELEDLAFRYLEPESYKDIASLLAEKRSERESYIANVQHILKNALQEAGIKGELSGRVKHIYSIYKKMKQKQLSFHQLYDIRAIRVLVHTQAQCYHTLGIVHGLWRHVPEQFDDYITNPKPNGYKSLHTVVVAEGRTLEIQIRTLDMHFEAELGICSHVNYKEGGKNKKNDYLNKKISSLRQLLAGDSPDSTHQWSESKRIYLFSRDGDIIELPKGATVLDFAYHVHTEVGNRAFGARVNGRFVPLTHQPNTGEQVEIVTKQNKEPNRDWLIDSLGYLTTERGKSKLRQWFNRQDRQKNIATGMAMLSKEFERLSLGSVPVDYLLEKLDTTADELYLSLVMGEISLTQLTNIAQNKLNQQKPDEKAIIIKTPIRSNKFNIELDGLDNVLLHLAKCCNPVHGEPIAGFITTSRGVSIHNAHCHEYQKLTLATPERAIKARWQADFGRYQPVIITIHAYDRRGLLRDLTAILDKEKVNINRAETLSCDDNIARMTFAIEVAGLDHLSRLLAKLEQEPTVILARRSTPPTNPEHPYA